jgi:pimeloyl-ACP methyl ester carboxylesterase
MFRKIKLLLILYCLVGIALYHFQESLIFHPSAKPLKSVHPVYQELTITVNQKESISILRFVPESVSKGLIIFFYPNHHRAEYYSQRSSFFTQRGFEVWIPDYPGFGNSLGNLTEQSLYKWADNVFKLAASQYTSDSILLYGQSFGSTMASYLGSYNASLRAVILESPYYSLEAQLKKYAAIYPVAQMSSFEFPVWRFLDESRCPVRIYYGKRDEIVSAADIRRLNKHLKSGDVFLKIESATHLRIHQDSAWINSMDEFLKGY